MSKLTSIFTYSIGKKLIMGLTGLFLITFLIMHLLGNLLLFSGPEAFSEYAHFMGTNPLIRIMEIVLFAGFLFHIVDGLWLAKQNAAARPVKYARSAGSKNSTWFSRNMHWTGSIMLIFLILHLISFFFLGRFGIDLDVTGNQADYQSFDPEYQLYWKVIGHFQIWWYSVIYILAMIFMGFHLAHGFQSAFQTMGWAHPKLTPVVKATGMLYAVVIPAAYAAMPLYFLIDYLL